ncbi:hypothetical protein IW261DRAFT_1417035 [Armillaria novae-zelandiae]|uniref:GPI anchored protein n=1 Tax=Armillaria novae-zelandiae TaxID=153914 RepID=A0AA39PJ58_9AGAR|nr:hypothetical protein IW261DRAFT_1417035 [Armillaria novae-zelandiae]
MKFSLFSLSAVCALVGSALAQGDLTINTPILASSLFRSSGLTQCLPTLLSWTGGTGPYFLTVTSGTDPNGNPIANLGEQSGTSFTWTVTFPQGTGLVFNIRDQTGSVKQTAPVTVQTGGSTDCTSSSASGSSTSGSTGSTTAGATTTAATSTGGATSTTPAGTTSRTTAAASSGASTSRASSAGSSGTSAGSSAAASSSGNAAPTQFSSMGAAGVIGAAIVALFA